MVTCVHCNVRRETCVCHVNNGYQNMKNVRSLKKQATIQNLNPCVTQYFRTKYMKKNANFFLGEL